eukprot:TRINITY_DN38332_c0_g1_i1.p1 TRINITY_DN38332_c0_g1~~TRINITY_DN38332_c0_g1_i1.p1  ORF type:complete len:175 (-),score=76.14 TRINITY_DN38332_c0_g1_i1:277-801(-)
MGKGAGRGKSNSKPTGRRTFSTVDEMASGTSSAPAWVTRRKEREKEAAGDDEEEEEELEEGEGEEGEDDDRKGKGVAGLIETANLNVATKSAVKVRDAVASGAGPSELSRREREELQKQASKERYMKLQEQGKTDEAKKDLERLALIRKQRQEAAQRKEEEKKAKEAKKVETRK